MTTSYTAHPGEPHAAGAAERLNWLRAGVLGANDGIVSVAGIVVGVAGATAERGPVFTAGLAGLVAGAVSMSLGEYISVSSQRDSEQAMLAKERQELATDPDAELEELVSIYEAKGISRRTAELVAAELTASDPFTAHAEAELHINPDEIVNPWHAAIASAVAFVTGAVLPLVAILLPGPSARVPVTIGAVLVALGLAGAVSAHLGGSSALKAVLRIVIGGAAGLLLTYAIGNFFGTAVS